MVKRKKRRRNQSQQPTGEADSSRQVQAFQMLVFKQILQAAAFRQVLLLSQECHSLTLVSPAWQECRSRRSNKLFRHCRPRSSQHQQLKCRVTQMLHLELPSCLSNLSTLSLIPSQVQPSHMGNKCLPHSNRSRSITTNSRHLFHKGHLSLSLQPIQAYRHHMPNNLCCIHHILRIRHLDPIPPRCHLASLMVVLRRPALCGTVSQTVKMIGGTTRLHWPIKEGIRKQFQELRRQPRGFPPKWEGQAVVSLLCHPSLGPKQQCPDGAEGLQSGVTL
mmetsp:Transcript_28497/g.58871  ORF Transcript_28497/g.58871 Transcript_28497/m.58871 type:complete len:276 (-) Transcript_28497:48-875(-)